MATDWKARPGWEVTGRGAEPGEVRTGADGVQWWYDAEGKWQPVVFPRPDAAERAARLEAEAG